MSLSLSGGISMLIDGSPFTIGLLSVEVQQIETTSSSHPDMSWKEVDESGHFHAFASDRSLPTLISRREVSTLIQDDDGYVMEEIGGVEWHCRICDVEIHPRWIFSSWRTFKPGRKSWTVEVQEWIELGKTVSVQAFPLPGTMLFGVASCVIAGSLETGLLSRLAGIGELGQRKG